MRKSANKECDKKKNWAIQQQKTNNVVNKRTPSVLAYTWTRTRLWKEMRRMHIIIHNTNK